MMRIQLNLTSGVVTTIKFTGKEFIMNFFCDDLILVYPHKIYHNQENYIVAAVLRATQMHN